MASDACPRTNLPFLKSLQQFQRLLPDEAACASYLERLRWPQGFTCRHCGTAGEPYRFVKHPGVLGCRKCLSKVSLTAGTVMEQTHMPLFVWFRAAYLLASRTGGISAKQLQRQLGLKRYETAFRMLKRLRARMADPSAERIGKARSRDYVEVDETWIGRAAQGERRGPSQVLVVAAIEVRHRKPKNETKARKRERYAESLRLQVLPNRGPQALHGFVEDAVQPGSKVVTDGWKGYRALADRGYEHVPIAGGGDAQITESCLPMSHLVFSSRKSWLHERHHGVSPRNLQAYLDEFSFRFNRRSYPSNAFCQLLGISSETDVRNYREHLEEVQDTHC